MGAAAGCDAALHLMLITNEPQIARFAIDCGIDWVFIDLETHGKRARQGHRDTVISDHSLEDVSRVRAVVPQGTLLVRINPWHASSQNEIEEVLARGADLIMLPMFRTLEEIARCADVVRQRARLMPLVETPDAVGIIDEVAAHAGVSHIHVGLNDLHLALGMRFMFEPLADGIVDRVAQACARHGKPFGFGGVARVGEGLLPAELLLGEHARLGSRSVILSRTFHRQARTLRQLMDQMDLQSEVTRLRESFARHLRSSPQALEENRQTVVQIVRRIAQGVAGV